PDSGVSAALNMAKIVVSETVIDVVCVPHSRTGKRRNARHESLCERLRLKLPLTSSIIYPPCVACADYERNSGCRIQQPDAAHSLAWVVANAIMLAEALGDFACVEIRKR
ncbi:MAG TPA: hypothetical protein VN289_22010, partial [Paraburkholderia sp.]|nr:hypothetical protein [Paraburkholderia sp.]